MLTKGIIVETPINSNIFKVRIPFLEQAGFLNNVYYDAILSHEPALVDSYKVGDVVIIGFEDHNGDKPIIIGKLYLEDSESRGGANLDSLNVFKSATLPEGTTVGDINVYEFLNKLNRANSVNEDRDSQPSQPTNSWRNIKVEGTELLSTSTSSGPLNFKAGSQRVTITGSGNDITIDAASTSIPITDLR